LARALGGLFPEALRFMANTSFGCFSNDTNLLLLALLLLLLLLLPPGTRLFFL